MTSYDKIENVIRKLELKVDELEKMACRALEIEEDEILGNDFKKISDVAVWRLQTLHQQLLTKHHETFWIKVENRIEDNKEYFRYDHILHTKNPNIGQFDVLLEQGMISVDLLLCRPSFQKSGKNGGDTYSFKMKPKAMPLLFPESVTYTI